MDAWLGISAAKQRHPAGAEKGRVSRDPGELKDGWGLGNLVGFQAFERVPRGFGDRPDGPIRAVQLSQLDLLQIVADVVPRIAAGRSGDALER
jgi:hypothetical protein